MLKEVFTLRHHLCSGLCIDLLVNTHRNNTEFADQDEWLTAFVGRQSDMQNSHSVDWERAHELSDTNAFSVGHC